MKNTWLLVANGSEARLFETEFRPKPLVNIGKRPILWHVMKIYAHYGFKEFILSLGYKGEMIKEYFYNYEVLNNDFTIELGETKAVGSITYRLLQQRIRHGFFS